MGLEKRVAAQSTSHYFDNSNYWNELNISKEENLVLKTLPSNKNVILQKVDKSNSVVLVNQVDFIKRMKELLSDLIKFKGITVEPGKEINSYCRMKAN